MTLIYFLMYISFKYYIFFFNFVKKLNNFLKNLNKNINLLTFMYINMMYYI